MHLNKLVLVNFKNHSDLNLELQSGITCFTGNNGVGKSNILDAIHLLALCKSALNPIDTQLIKENNDFFIVEGFFDVGGKEEHIFVGLKQNQKKQFKRNKKAYKRLAEHIGKIPLVLISPYENEMILGGSELRRKFMDGVLAQVDEDYLNQLIEYNKILKNRNAYLKSYAKKGVLDEDMLETYNDQLKNCGKIIYQKRSDFIVWFLPIFQKYYEEISASKEIPALVYESQLHKETFEEGYKRSRQKDAILQRTTFGTHKDDLNFILNDKPLKKFASQGQQKSYLLAVKLAEYAFLEEHKKVKPILLLDDIIDKLDATRVKALLGRVAGKEFGQVFITDTSSSRLESIFSTIPLEATIYNITKEGITKVE